MKDISPDHTIILAKMRHIEELEQLSICTAFVDTIGLLIHQIQAERGASCLYLASSGQRFGNERSDIIEQNQDAELKFREALQRHLDQNNLVDAKQLTLVSWILLGFDQMTALRHQITLHKISFPDCIASFNRFIGSLISLIFDITDNAVNSRISTSLLALYNLVQGKEFAGQERAVGSYMFGSGQVQQEHQQKLLELIVLQDRHFELFCQFGGKALHKAWTAAMGASTQHRYQQYRHKLTHAQDGQSVKIHDGYEWFELCSQRLSEMWQMQCWLIKDMHDMLETLINDAKNDLAKTRQYLQKTQRQPAKQPTALDSTFFNLSIPVENAYTFLAHDKQHSYPMESIVSLLQQQSQQIAEIENELAETKQALAERKQIERAKGLLMSQRGISEVEAYKILRSTAMEQNRKIIDVANNILARHSLV
ncbi:response regulator receiver and ANTAR domain protein [Methylobacillus rhizosphaerae]|uniref:Response regulator receiver and ANTAR domain protein n=1 Tax=Methylobacillus rhizosphaerae TaxID=551994 RepID=A0A239A562_9PROT|nr:nitrate regulatory protein [Methylobacillus rhizosphaerae]SNR90806.1 response regulator receiver and ANTAR domain protein [Methylobacillus rhizosphaerae]